MVGDEYNGGKRVKTFSETKGNLKGNLAFFTRTLRNKIPVKQ